MGGICASKRRDTVGKPLVLRHRPRNSSAPRRLLIWSYNQLAGWGASADGQTLTVVALKHDTADDDGREKTREFSTEAGVSAAIATLLTDYVGAYRSQRAEMLAAREPEPEPDAASDV